MNKKHNFIPNPSKTLQILFFIFIDEQKHDLIQKFFKTFKLFIIKQKIYTYSKVKILLLFSIPNPWKKKLIKT